MELTETTIDAVSDLNYRSFLCRCADSDSKVLVLEFSGVYRYAGARYPDAINIDTIKNAALEVHHV